MLTITFALLVIVFGVGSLVSKAVKHPNTSAGVGRIFFGLFRK
ncbi:hypothetical protein [Fimbriiglobus ruber]|nr:hypothetical protein [Fimbriiglobus ruber]